MVVFTIVNNDGQKENAQTSEEGGEVKEERKRREEREIVTRRAVRESQRGAGRGAWVQRGFRGRDSAAEGPEAARQLAATSPQGARGAGEGRFSPSALALGRCRAFVPGLHFLPGSPGPGAQSSQTYFAESDSLQGV